MPYTPRPRSLLWAGLFLCCAAPVMADDETCDFARYASLEALVQKSGNAKAQAQLAVLMAHVPGCAHLNAAMAHKGAGRPEPIEVTAITGDAAAHPPEDKPKTPRLFGYDIQSQVGAILNRGNAVNTNVSFELGLDRKEETYKDEIDLRYDIASTNGLESKNALRVKLQRLYPLHDKMELYGLGSYSFDKFDDPEQRLLFSGGFRWNFERDWFDLHKAKFALEVGPGLLVGFPQNDDDDILYRAAGRAQGKAELWVTEDIQLLGKMELLGDKDVDLNSYGAISVAVMPTLSVRYSAESRTKFNAPAGRERTDIRSLISFVYGLTK